MVCLAVAVVVAACSSQVPAGSVEADGALRAYTAELAKPGRSFHLVQTGTISAGGQTRDLYYELDASGGDMAAVMTVAGQTVEVRVVGGTAFAHAGSGWQTVPGGMDVARDILDVFRYVGDTANLRFVERVQESGTAVFHFRAINPVPYQTSEMRALGLTGSIPELDFFVRQDGVPVRVIFRSTAQQGNATVEARSTIEFSRWGEPITITAPR
jgi:hypothetical protein